MGCTSSSSLRGPFEKQHMVFRSSLDNDVKLQSNNNNNNNNNNNKSDQQTVKLASDKSKFVHNGQTLQGYLNKGKVAPKATDFCQNGYVEEPLKKAPTPLMIFSPQHCLADNDTAGIVPIISDCSPPHNQRHSDFQHFNEHKEEIHQQIKSALKTRRSNEKNRLIANRPMKNVTFVDSVTVVTVF